MSPAPVGNQALWLSVRPPFAQSIIDGSKRVELRRVRPRVPQGTLAILYATSPIQSIIGMFILDRVEQDKPHFLWERNQRLCGIGAEDFNAYFKDVANAVGLHIGKTWPLKDNVPLASIRGVWPGFSPPQSFRYLQWHQQSESIALVLPENYVKPLLLRSHLPGR